jgi:hypothetical protein
MSPSADDFWDKVTPAYRQARGLGRLTSQEADAAFDAFEEIPLSQNEIDSIVNAATTEFTAAAPATPVERVRRKFWLRTAVALIAAAACLVAAWFLIPEKMSFAAAVKRITGSKTITWSQTTYIRERDGQRTWIRVMRRGFAYREPGLWRMTDYDDAGKPVTVSVSDSKSGRKVAFNLKEKKSVDWSAADFPVFQPRGPFGWIADALEKQPLEFVGQRTASGMAVNVFRFRWGKAPDPPSTDVWIDPRSKELVGFSEPGTDLFDPLTIADLKRPLPVPSSPGTVLGTVTDEIVYDANLDPALFRLVPPKDFQSIARPEPVITETELIEWLGSLARVNQNVFPAAITTSPDFDPTRILEISENKSRTDAEQKMYDLYTRYLQVSLPGEHDVPVVRFLREQTVEGSFRYIGVGVKLGSADRLVCWYRSKSTGTYRAIYGDLSVKDVDSQELPLPESFAVEEQAKNTSGPQTVSWTTMFYSRRISKDGKRSWLAAQRSDFAFRQPGLLRVTQYDEEGHPRWVHISDVRSRKSLDLDLKDRKVAKGPFQYQMPIGPQGHSPLAAVARALKLQPLEFVGPRKRNGQTMNVFRAHGGVSKTGRSHDYWIDSRSKQLIGYTDVGSDAFDPETDTDRGHPAEKTFSTGQMLGTITFNIVADAKLDADLFRLTPPPQFETAKDASPSPLTEAQITEWLGAIARVNHGVFPTGLTPRGGFEPTHFSEINRMRRSDWTAAENAMYELVEKYAETGDHGRPTERFLKEQAVPGSFRYVGVDVKLGDARRIVCWYQAKTKGNYRAIYGDLSVKDVDPKDLPLPVGR